MPYFYRIGVSLNLQEDLLLDDRGKYFPNRRVKRIANILTWLTFRSTFFFFHREINEEVITCFCKLSEKLMTLSKIFFQIVVPRYLASSRHERNTS